MYPVIVAGSAPCGVHFLRLILRNGIRGHYGRDREIEYIFHVESRQMPGIPQSKLNVYIAQTPLGFFVIDLRNTGASE